MSDFLRVHLLCVMKFCLLNCVGGVICINYRLVLVLNLWSSRVTWGQRKSHQITDPSYFFVLLTFPVFAFSRQVFFQWYNMFLFSSLLVKRFIQSVDDVPCQPWWWDLLQCLLIVMNLGSFCLSQGKGRYIYGIYLIGSVSFKTLWLPFYLQIQRRMQVS